MEGYFLHAELDLCGFDLNARFGTAAQKGLIQVIQLVKGVCPCGYIVTVDCEFVSQGLWTTIGIKQTFAVFVEQALSNVRILVLIYSDLNFKLTVLW